MSRTLRAVFASTMLTLLALATVATAQNTPTPASPSSGQSPGEADAQKAAQSNTPKNGPSATAVGELVVTGTRIRTTDFNSPSPITVITPEQAQLQGTNDIAQLLQQSVLANNAVQINTFFTGFVVNGGPGVNTLSLRGLGSQRTLFLINGQRLGPAGVGGTVGPVDLNVLNFPLAEISNIQILKDGASSVYGSDAIGGVVNIITKTDYDGGDIRGFYGPSQDGGANHYELDASFGKTWSRGYINVGASWYKATALTVGSERPYFSCASDDATVSPGGMADLIDPATGRAKCNNIFSPAVEDVGTPNGVVIFRPLAGSMAAGGVTGQYIHGWQAVNLVVCNNGRLESCSRLTGRAAGPAAA